MNFRPFNVFSLIAYLLIGLAITGFVLGPRFVFDPGQNVGTHSDWFYQPIYYLVTGILMFLNGLWTPVSSPEEAGGRKSDGDKEAPGRRRRRTAAAAAEVRGPE